MQFTNSKWNAWNTTSEATDLLIKIYYTPQSSNIQGQKAAVPEYWQVLQLKTNETIRGMSQLHTKQMYGLVDHWIHAPLDRIKSCISGCTYDWRILRSTMTLSNIQIHDLQLLSKMGLTSKFRNVGGAWILLSIVLHIHVVGKYRIKYLGPAKQVLYNLF